MLDLSESVNLPHSMTQPDLRLKFSSGNRI
jgi:hypothetical protein